MCEGKPEILTDYVSGDQNKVGLQDQSYLQIYWFMLILCVMFSLLSGTKQTKPNEREMCCGVPYVITLSLLK